jgi:ABC-type dipeptide/oligopeptide/nickel transport system permease subunit
VYRDVTGEKYRVECTPSFLLSLAAALASAEGVSYIDIYRQLVKQVAARNYREAARRVGELLREK